MCGCLTTTITTKSLKEMKRPAARRKLKRMCQKENDPELVTCLPRSADMAELIKLAGPPIIKPVQVLSKMKSYKSTKEACSDVI